MHWVQSHVKKEFSAAKKAEILILFFIRHVTTAASWPAVGPYQHKEALQGGFYRISILLLFPAVSVPVVLVVLKE